MNSISFSHLQSDDGLAELIAALPGNGRLGVSVLAFEPSGSWCVADGSGGYVKDAQGRIITQSLDDAGVRRYWAAARAVDQVAVAAYKAEIDRANLQRMEKTFIKPDFSEGE